MDIDEDLPVSAALLKSESQIVLHDDQAVNVEEINLTKIHLKSF